MDEFSVWVSRKARKKWEKLDPEMYERVEEALIQLKTVPVPASHFDVIKIKGKDSEYRIRIRRHRVLYKVKWEIKEIEVYDVDRRDEHTYD